MENPATLNGTVRDQSGIAVDDFNSLREEVHANGQRITALEDKLRPEMSGRTYSTQHYLHAQSVTDETENEDFLYLSVKKAIPKVRECNFAQFKNRFEKNGTDGRYAVDVLVSGALLQQEIQEEHKLRGYLIDNAPRTQSDVNAKGLSKDKVVAKIVKDANLATGLIAQAQANGNAKWPRRLRIQSPTLLRILDKINQEKWSDRPRTYYRPFHALIWHQPMMKKALEELEEKHGAELDRRIAEAEFRKRTGKLQEELQDENDGVSSVGLASGEEEDDEMVMNSPEALASLRAYVEYMDQKIMPDYRRFENMDYSSNATVRFSDLWYLFRPGEFVYRQVNGEAPNERDFRSGKLVWKTYYTAPVPERLVAEATDKEEIRETEHDSDEPAFSLGCYYIDHTGEEFCVIDQVFKIEQFIGETPVTALPICPLRFYRNWERRIEIAKQTGESLIKFMTAKHCSYSGWTLTQTPDGDTAVDEKGVKQEQPEYINSEVMVDFREAFLQCPTWRPKPANMRQKIADAVTRQEDFRIRWWSGTDRAVLLGETTEIIPIKSGVTIKQRNAFIASDPFLQAVTENVRRLRNTTVKDLGEEDKALLTGRVFAYVFQERKFARLSVAKLRALQITDLALESLKIAPSVKQNLQASVQGHFFQKKLERRMDPDSASLDLIQGKGAGLFILLHGVPGVGKTATAEAIAQANHKPLFKITVGDLGMTPEKVETSLRDIFRLASIWDCILLLDEVDTFFAQRSRENDASTKNALVAGEFLVSSLICP
jgi:hypothetical protein